MQENQDDLHSALIFASDGMLEWAKALISAGAKVNGMPFIMAIQTNTEDIVKEMIAVGADLNYAFADTTPLVRAAESRYPNIVSLLVNAGANVNLKTPKGVTPLMAALSPGRTNATLAEEQKVISILKQAGAE